MNLSKKSDRRMWQIWGKAGALSNTTVTRLFNSDLFRETLDRVVARELELICRVDCLIEKLLRATLAFPDGSTGEQVEKMSLFEQIEFLERLAASDDFAWSMPDLSLEVSLFVEEIESDIEIFRIIDNI